jgi:hypothetical protein
VPTMTASTHSRSPYCPRFDHDPAAFDSPRGRLPLIDPLVNGAEVSLIDPVLDSHEEMPLPGGAAKGAGMRESA